MEHLVESHLGGYYVSNSDPEIIKEYCESCGDHDWIIISWEEGQKIDALKQYFSNIKSDSEEIDKDRLSGITKSEAIESILYNYKEDINIILNLFEEKFLSSEEMKELIKIVKSTQKQQIALVLESYSNDKIKTLKKKKYK